MATSKKELSQKQRNDLFTTLKTRFESNMQRHTKLQWEKIQTRLEKAQPQKLYSLNEMERTGG